ncbi:MAG: putative 7-carboxy-7-deazaguanine synthase QueE [Lachnospiraceae bacterium]|nr:putative 7-carboxy-7-deazaguanine synthase QueE [Lachnospiraceae bacterium]
MAEFKVVEIFESINGEGMKSGELAVFIRFFGCNLRCTYCDTLYALEKDAPVTLMDEEEIYKRVKETGIKNVTITGGEPLIQKDIEVLFRRLLKDEELFLEIETNGSVEVSPYRINDRITFTLDYKLPGSGAFFAMEGKNFQNVNKNDTVKFVVSDLMDLDTAHQKMLEYKLIKNCNIILSPVFGSIEAETIVEYMKNKNLNDVRLQLQIHKFIWDPDKKGV